MIVLIWVCIIATFDTIRSRNLLSHKFWHRTQPNHAKKLTQISLNFYMEALLQTLVIIFGGNSFQRHLWCYFILETALPAINESKDVSYKYITNENFTYNVTWDIYNFKARKSNMVACLQFLKGLWSHLLFSRNYYCHCPSKPGFPYFCLIIRQPIVLRYFRASFGWGVHFLLDLNE